MTSAPLSPKGETVPSAPLVVVRKLRKSFALPERTLEVLGGIDLEIGRGELVSLVGKSGVGKSTFLQILGTLDEPSGGTVHFDGVDVFALPEPELASFRNRSIGFIFQFHHLLPEFTALENVMMPALIARRSFSQARERALWLLERVGLSPRLGHRPGELSGGEQQRVAIARALMMDPRLLLADEPTGNLDQQTSDEIHSLILELNAETGVTFLIATHNFDLARQMKRHLVLRHGTVEELTAEEAVVHTTHRPRPARGSI
jgi:lipoprotein-releasing system ATP-binding protein